MGSLSTSFDYLATCSESALESYELARWGRAANLRKQFLELIEEWVQCEVEARLARMTRDFRRVDTHAAAGCDAQAILPALAQQLALPLISKDAEIGCGTIKRAAQLAVHMRAVRNIPSTKFVTTLVRRIDLRGARQSLFVAGCPSGNSPLEPPANLLSPLRSAVVDGGSFCKLQNFLHQRPAGALSLGDADSRRSPKTRPQAPRPFRSRLRARTSAEHAPWTSGGALGGARDVAMSA
jgi:hypothetical protein